VWAAGGSASAADPTFDALVKKSKAEKPQFAERHQTLLKERYDLSDRPADGVTMSRGKPVQGGIRVLLPEGMTWEKLAGMTPEQIKGENLWPGFYPLPPKPEAGHGLPKKGDEVKQTGDLTR
jgi:hypothetical protein